MGNEVENKTTKKWISEGIIIATSPIVAYLFTYEYEAGFCNVFGIPVQFISIDLATTFFVILGLYTLFFNMLLFGNLIFMFLDKSHPIYRRLTITLVFFLLFFLAPIYLYGIHMWREWIWFACIFGFLALLLFVFPLLTQRHKGSFIDKLQAQAEVDRQPVTILDYLFLSLGLKVTLIISSLLIGLLLSGLMGRASAIKQNEFLVTSSSPELVVLRIYKDKLICAPFERTTKKIQKSFIILKAGDDPKLMLRSEKVGPLTLEKQ